MDPTADFKLMKTIPWGLIPSSEGLIGEKGLLGAIEHRQRFGPTPSPHRSSSGRTSEIQREHGRKGRQEHYRRKAILEAEKEAERRRKFERRHPEGNEAYWMRREANRKTRKAGERQARKRRTRARA